MSVDKCVACGETIPEGRQVCPICEERARALAEYARSKLMLDRMKKLGYYRTRTVTAFQKIKSV